MKLHRTVALLLLTLATGCASGRVVRLEAEGAAPLVLTARADETASVELERGEFKEAMSKLAQGLRAPANPHRAARQLFELRVAGERYGKVMGKNAARAFALLATVAIGNTAAGFASRVPTLPGSAQAAVQSGAQVGIRLSAVGEVRAVAITGEAVTIALAPGALAMTAQAMRGAGAGPVDEEGHNHHIATDKWWDSAHNDGPWSPRFQKIFDKAGMSLDDPANIVRVKGHKGPHPQEYHERVLRRLTEATRRCRTQHECRDALTEELRRLAREIATEGTRLNELVRRIR
jgi:hypothetical protein